MRGRRIAAVGVLLTATVAVTVADGPRQWSARLRGFNEVPAVSTVANGRFNATVSEDGTSVSWELRYDDLEGDVQQAHIHLAQKDVNGGISVFLCTNLGNGPAGTQACPPPPATMSGSFTAADVIGPAGQGIAATEFGELLRAIRAGKTYANVHSSKFPGGEVRGQLSPAHRHKH
jgi:hypothetical protein